MADLIRCPHSLATDRSCMWWLLPDWKTPDEIAEEVAAHVATHHKPGPSECPCQAAAWARRARDGLNGR